MCNHCNIRGWGFENFFLKYSRNFFIPYLTQADFIFYPERKNSDALILELKVGSTPDDAIAQIKNKDYALRFKGRLGEKQAYTGRILAVGISYSKKTKKHSCKVEIL